MENASLPAPADPGVFIPPTYGYFLGRLDPDLCVLGKTATVTVIVMVTKREPRVLVLTLPWRMLGVGPSCRWRKGDSEVGTSILQRSLCGIPQWYLPLTLTEGKPAVPPEAK